jgi:hypothetical protein
METLIGLAGTLVLVLGIFAFCILFVQGIGWLITKGDKGFK